MCDQLDLLGWAWAINLIQIKVVGCTTWRRDRPAWDMIYSMRGERVFFPFRNQPFHLNDSAPIESNLRPLVFYGPFCALWKVQSGLIELLVF